MSRVSDAGLRERIRDRIPKATKDCTSWAVRAWLEWGEKRNSEVVNEDDEFVRVPYDIIAIPYVELNYWLAKFVVEVRKRENGEAYYDNTLYQMVCRLQGFIRENGRAELNIFQQPEFKLFRDKSYLRRCWRMCETGGTIQ